MGSWHSLFGVSVSLTHSSVENPMPPEAIAFNFSYIVIVNLVITAVISGIIIDSFSEKRMRQEEID